MSACQTVLCIFNPDELCFFISIIAISVVLVGSVLLYLYWGKDPHMYYGMYIMLIVIGVLILSVSTPTTECGSSPFSGVTVDQSSGMVEITVVDVGNLDSALIAGADGLTGHNGTRSTVMRSISPGDRFTLRSNDEVISYLNNPENNITVPTIAGTETVENVGELPFEYREAPAAFVNPEANISNYDNASVATVACLYESADDFELGGRQIPAGSPIPCSTPFLAQRIEDEATLSTHVKPSSGPDEGKTLVSPVTLNEGEYQLVGIIEGQRTLVQSVKVTGEVLQKNNSSS